METTTPVRRVERVRHELRRRDVTVVQVAPLGPDFVRVVFGGDALAGFVSLGFDDHVKLLFDNGAEAPLRRDYTPRHFDPERQTLTIDFALHGHGVAAEWARAAQVGQGLTIGGPRGSMIVPHDYDWHLLVGDATAAPAIGRRLSELPAAARVIVVVQLADLTVLELHRCRAQLDLHQVDDAASLVRAVATLKLPVGEGYAWGAGEAATMAQLRDLLLGAKAHPREAMRVAAYWKRGTADHHEELGP